MKKSLILAAALPILASCASDEIVENSQTSSTDQEIPIAFSTFKRNVTRASNLQTNLHYNFGVWARKIKDGTPTQPVMDNYLVGYTNTKNRGYYLNGATTWGDKSTLVDHGDHLSPWFYENLGKDQYQYTGNEGFYTMNDTRYMSANANQYLRYWDLAYQYTNFYCYAPYMAEGVTPAFNTDGSTISALNFDATTSMKDGYDEPLNKAYIDSKVDRSLSEFMYAGVQATNSELKDVNIPFKHMGAQLFIRFYENIPGYRVEIINLTDGSISSNSIDRYQGVQATPAKKNDDGTYELDKYFVTAGGKVSFDANATATFVPTQSGADRSDKNLMFKIPGAVTTYPTGQMPSGFGANFGSITDYAGTEHSVIPEATGAPQTSWSWSPTIYYPVAQDPNQKVGFTFHVSYRIIAKDNGEVTYVHNATVHVPSTVTTWKEGTRYIYTFLITRNTSGTTNPDTAINPEDPTPGTQALFPIVFDNCSIEDWQKVEEEYQINQE